MRGPALALCGALATLLLAGPSGAQQTEAEARYEATLLADPMFGELLTEMSKSWPVEWREMVRESTRRYVQGDPPPAVEAYRREYFQRFNALLRQDMVKAPTGAIGEYARANSEFMGLLMRENAEVCAATATSRPAPAGAAPINPATQKALVKAQLAMMRAATAGKAKPANHGPPSRQDDLMVSTAFRESGGQLADIGKVGDPRSDLTPRQRCDAAGRWAVALAKQPNAVIARMMNR